MKAKSTLSVFVLLTSLCCEAQSNVYSLAIYSAGNSWADLCSLTLPFPPYQYRLTERSWCEDANGLTIMDIKHEKVRGNVLRRLLEVQCGTNSFSIPLDSVPPKKAKNGNDIASVKNSGDLARLIIGYATSRGGHVVTNRPTVLRTSWICQSREAQDIIVLDGDYFTEVQRFLEQTYGAPETTIRSSTPVGNGRSVTYTPQQIGVVVNLTADSTQTIVSVIGRRKP